MDIATLESYKECYKRLITVPENNGDPLLIIDVCLSMMSSIHKPGCRKMARLKAMGAMKKLPENAEIDMAQKLIVLFIGTDDSCLQENIGALLISRLSPDIDAMLYNAIETGNGNVAAHVRHYVLSMLGIRDEYLAARI